MCDGQSFERPPEPSELESFTVYSSENTSKMCDEQYEDEESWDASPELVEDVEELRCSSILPAKSGERYKAVYDTFAQWKKAENVDEITEDVILTYFGELAKKYKPPTLWATYSMLRSTMHINDNINMGDFKKLTAFIKQESSGYEGRKTKIFSSDDIKTFLAEAPDDRYLVTKVVLIFGITGGCRSTELTRLTLDDVLDRGDVMVVKLRDTETGNIRTFTIEGEFLTTVRTYQALRPDNAMTDRFFMTYRNGKCMNQVIGKNKLGGMPKEIAQFLKLPNPELYTGHSYRRSLSIIRNRSGQIKVSRVRDWKSPMAEPNFEFVPMTGCPEDAEPRKRIGDQQMSRNNLDESSETITFDGASKRIKIENDDSNDVSTSPRSNIVIKESPNETIINLDKQHTTLHFTNCTNITINYGS